ncbi:MAG: hypothetical protein GKR97_18430 [Rhizobiaceae bacterium]|nr:hypothetical protein [Rhizobiaceae bacterium]
MELRYTRRTACERPHDLRIIHALLHEVAAIILTCQLFVWIGGHTFGVALVFNFGPTLTYSVYTYVFHLAYDRVGPV